jgi:type I restriction enzyme, S subunit
VKGDGSIPEETITAAGLANSSSRIVLAGTNIVATRMGVGAVTRYPMDVAINQDLMALTPAKGLDADFLYHWLRSKKTTFAAVATGTTVKGIRKDLLLSFPLALPPLDEQRRIAEVLRSVDDAIAAHQTVASTLSRSLKKMRHELLGVDPDGTVDDLPTEWLLKPLEDIATVERGKFSIRPRNDPRYFGGTTPFIQTGDITGAGDYIVNHSQTLNDMGVGVSRVFAAGTIMTTIAANIGDFSIASYPMACPDSVVGIVPNAGIDTFWLYSTLTCFKSALDRAATQNAQKNINLQTLRPLLIPVPPKELMLELSETLSLGGKALEEAEQGLKNLNSLKSALMTDLLSGRVRVPA